MSHISQLKGHDIASYCILHDRIQEAKREHLSFILIRIVTKDMQNIYNSDNLIILQNDNFKNKHVYIGLGF